MCVFLGHSDPGFTLRTSIHLLPDDLPEPWGVNTMTTGATETDRNEAPAATLALAGRAGKVRQAETRRNGQDELVMMGSGVRVSPSALVESPAEAGFWVRMPDAQSLRVKNRDQPSRLGQRSGMSSDGGKEAIAIEAEEVRAVVVERDEFG